jgi:diaminohydroxyphosphoribosylaminopyrimidine deaminase/5-amino-6-(5-phosphoribosylamino)uracil reductase
VVVDGRGRTPLGSRLLAGSLVDRTIVATTAGSPSNWRAEVAARGARILVLPESDSPESSGLPMDGRARPRGVDLPRLLEALGDLEVMSVLVEGGGLLLGSLFDARLVDKVYAFVAPRVFGGAGRSPVMGTGVATPAEAAQLERTTVEPVGDDLLIVGYPRYAAGQERLDRYRGVSSAQDSVDHAPTDQAPMESIARETISTDSGAARSEACSPG